MDYEQGASVAQVRSYLQEQGVTWTFATPDSVKDVIADGFVTKEDVCTNAALQKACTEHGVE